MLYVLCLLAGVGLTHILVDGKIADSFRQWTASETDKYGIKPFLKKVVECYQCGGWWCGLLIGMVPFRLEGLLVWSSLLLLTFLADKYKTQFPPIVQPLLFVGSMFMLSHLYSAFLIGFATSFLAVVGRDLIDFLESHIILQYEDTKTTGS